MKAVATYRPRLPDRDVQRVQNVVVDNARQTQLQLVSPTNQTIRNSQFLADGSVDPNRLKTTAAGFGAVTGAQPLRTIQAQLGSRSE